MPFNRVGNCFDEEAMDEPTKEEREEFEREELRAKGDA
jgi:hypothetical protein